MKNALIFLSLAWFFNATLGAAELPAECEIAANAVQEASAIRGLSIRSKVPCEVHGKELVEKFLRSTIETKLPQNKLKFEEIVYKAIGVVPDDFDYREGVVKLYLSQLGGYYDPDKKHFIMASWMPTSMQTAIAIHELTHALQDQHYNLNKIIDSKLDNGDMGVARSALVEGDATAVMIDYTRKLMHMEPLAQEKNIDSLLIQQVMSGGMMSGLEGFPEPLKNLLLFPYISGLRFVFTLLQSGGYPQVDKAFKRLPESSEEILHPEKYLKSGKDFDVIPDSEMSTYKFFEPETGGDRKPIYTDTIGEFLISAVIGNALGDRMKAAQAGKGWGGDKIAIFDLSGGGHFIVWSTRWDSSTDANEFFEAYLAGVSKSYRTHISTSDEGWVSLTNSKQVKLKKNGRDVVLGFKVP